MLNKIISITLLFVLLGYGGIASGRFVTSDPVGLQGGLNTVDSVGIPPTPHLNTYYVRAWESATIHRSSRTLLGICAR